MLLCDQNLGSGIATVDSWPLGGIDQLALLQQLGRLRGFSNIQLLHGVACACVESESNVTRTVGMVVDSSWRGLSSLVQKLP